MNKYEAVDSRGKLHKRGTKNRTYTHCVVAYRETDTITYNGKEVYIGPEVSWAGSPALAEARAKTFRNQTGYLGDNTRTVYPHVEIIEAVQVK